jgi:hypothetical protein
MSIDLEHLLKYFGKDCTDSEKIEIENWKNSSDDNLKLFNRMRQIWEASAHAPEFVNPDFEKAWKKIQAGTGIIGTQPKQKALGIQFNLILRIAAAILILIGLYSILNKSYFEKPELKIVQTFNSGK